MYTKATLEAINAIIENHEMNEAGFKCWESVNHIYETYEIDGYNAVDTFLIKAFLSSVEDDSSNDNIEHAYENIHKVIDMYDYGKTFSSGYKISG